MGGLLLGVLCLLLFALHFTISLHLNFPFHAAGHFEISFLKWKYAIAFPEHDTPQKISSSLSLISKLSSQAGFVQTPKLRMPFKKRLRQMLLKLFLDWRTWKILGAYGLKLVARIFKLLKIRVHYLKLSDGDPMRLGQMAAWLATLSAFPVMNFPIHYDFETRAFTLQLTLRSRFSLAKLLWSLGLIICGFPWLYLAKKMLKYGFQPQLSEGQSFWLKRIQAIPT